MAFFQFQRIFSNKRGPKGQLIETNWRKNDHSQKSAAPKLDRSRIRLVVYAESDRGRTPFFDSNAITCVEDMEKNLIKTAPKAMRSKGLTYSSQKETSVPQHKQAPKYHFQKLGNDVKVLEEMMFGIVPMAFKGLTLKVHLLRSPPQLMVSKVFIPEKPTTLRDSSQDVESDTNSLPGSSADFSSGEFSASVPKSKSNPKRSIPMDVPTKDLASDCSTDDDSGFAAFTSSGSLRTSFPSPSNNSISSYSSLHRRWMRAQTTSLDSHPRRESSLVTESSLTRPHRNKLAVGIIFGCDEKDEEHNELFQSFFFSHFALVEGHVEKLRSVIEKAYFNSRNCLPAIMEALQTFRNDIFDLYMAPRLSEPIWLTMMSTTTYRTKLCEKFMETFVSLVTKYDNKNCKFFVSTLLSAVLTQHLAWVATVTPADGTPSRTYLDKHTAKWVDALAKTHPYNPLWAQLGDLYGAIGHPLKLSRTVVVGKKADVVKRFLYFLSYFIRCSEVHENSDLQCLSNIVNDTRYQLPISPTLSERALSDMPDRSTSPLGGSTLYARQNSGGTLAGLKSSNSDYSWSFSKTKLDIALEEVNESHLTKVHSEPSCFHKPINRNLPHSCSNLVRLDDCKHCVTSRGCNCDHRTHTVLCKCSGSAENVEQSNTVVPSQNSQNCCLCPLKNELTTLPPKSQHQNEHRKDVSPFQSQTHTSSISAEPVGLSDIHIYDLDSFPISCVSAKIIESPPMERVMLAGASNTLVKSENVFTKTVPESIPRSQSFSDGKIKSRLTQQLGEGQDEVADEQKWLSSPTSSSSLLTLSLEMKKEDNSRSPSRQNSQDGRFPQGRPPVLPKSRPITPTEMSRRRHLSSTSSIDYEAFDPMIHCTELKIPSSQNESGQWHIKAFDRNFGHSLLAGYTDHYMSDFVLQGTSDTNFKSHLLNDLQMTVKHSVLDEPINEAVCVIADTDSWTVEVASSKMIDKSPSGCTTWTSSQLVADLIESVVEISKLKMSAEFCLMHLEDRLQEIYFKSLLVSKHLHPSTTYSQSELSSMLGFEPSDMPLLLAITETLTPSQLQRH